MDRSAVVVVRLPRAMLEAVDRLARAQYVSRSEAMRALVRSGVAASEVPPWLPGGGSEGESEAA
jgi:metal-responsive CopG/Arc/MetJ family transcriptional regulator